MIKTLRQIEVFILFVVVYSCATVSCYLSYDNRLPVRNIIWWAGIVFLMALLVYRWLLQSDSIDFSTLTRAIFPVFLGYFLFCMISTIVAINQSEAVYELCRIALCITSLFVIVTVLKDSLLLFSKYIVLMTIMLSVVGIQAINEMKALEDMVGTMGNKNIWTSALFLLLPFCVYCISKSKGLWRVLGVLASVMVVFNLVCIMGRSSMLALCIFFLVLTLYNPKWFFGLAALAALVLAICFFYRDIPVIGNHISFIVSTSSISERGRIWAESLNMFRDNPAGVGIGNWRTNMPLYAAGISDWAYSITCFKRPHNDYIWVLTETGIPGFVAYISLFIISIYYFAKSRAFVFMGGMLGYMAIAFFSFPRERTFQTLMLIVYMGVALSLYHKQVGFNKKTLVPMFFIVVIIMSFIGFDFHKRYDASKRMRRIITAKSYCEWDVVLCELESSSWFSNLDPLKRPLAFYEGEACYHLGDLDGAMIGYEKALDVGPYEINVVNETAICFLFAGWAQESFALCMQSLNMWPNEEGVRANAAAFSPYNPNNRVYVEGS